MRILPLATLLSLCFALTLNGASPSDVSSSESAVGCEQLSVLVHHEPGSNRVPRLKEILGKVAVALQKKEADPNYKSSKRLLHQIPYDAVTPVTNVLRSLFTALELIPEGQRARFETAARKAVEKMSLADKDGTWEPNETQFREWWKTKMRGSRRFATYGSPSHPVTLQQLGGRDVHAFASGGKKMVFRPAEAVVFTNQKQERAIRYLLFVDTLGKALKSSLVPRSHLAILYQREKANAPSYGLVSEFIEGKKPPDRNAVLDGPVDHNFSEDNRGLQFLIGNYDDTTDNTIVTAERVPKVVDYDHLNFDLFGVSHLLGHKKQRFPENFTESFKKALEGVDVVKLRASLNDTLTLDERFSLEFKIHFLRFWIARP